MSKYIIKNCPCLDNSGVCQRCKNWGVESCQDCTDCVMKQIVDCCKNNQKLKWQVGEKPEQWISFNNPLSYQILQLLNMQAGEQ